MTLLTDTTRGMRICSVPYPEAEDCCCVDMREKFSVFKSVHFIYTYQESKMATLHKWSPLRMFRRHPISVSSEVGVDVQGLPWDSPSDVPQVLSTLSCLMKSTGVSWCVMGDLLLAHYLVPQVTRVCPDLSLPGWKLLYIIYAGHRNLCTIGKSQSDRSTL